MPSTELPHSLINDLITADQLPDVARSLVSEEETQARRWLLRIMVNRDALLEHLAYLRTQYPRASALSVPAERRVAGVSALLGALNLGFRHNQPLPEAEVERILSGGPKVIDSHAPVGQLLLSPTALADLAERLETELPDAWVSVLEEDGRDLMAQHDCPIPTPSSPRRGHDSPAPEPTPSRPQQGEQGEASNFVAPALAPEIDEPNAAPNFSVWCLPCER